MIEKVDRPPPGAAEAVSDDAMVAAYVWTERTTGVLRGLAHAFGNRFHALELIRSSADHGETPPPEVLDLLGGELDACRVLTERFRALVFTGRETPSACRVIEALSEALALRATHADARTLRCEVTVEGDPPAVLVAPIALMQGLLLLVLESVESALSPAVHLGGTADAAIVRVTSGAAVPPADDATLRAVAWLLRRTSPPPSVVRDLSGASPAIVLTLPSLAASRRVERSAR